MIVDYIRQLTPDEGVEIRTSGVGLKRRVNVADVDQIVGG